MQQVTEVDGRNTRVRVQTEKGHVLKDRTLIPDRQFQCVLAADSTAVFGGAVISMAQMAAGRMYIDAR